MTLHDYLVRNYNLFRLESTYEIRLEIEDQIARMKPWLGDDGSCVFGGWARMCLPIQMFTIVEVARPLLGEVMGFFNYNSILGQNSNGTYIDEK